MYRYRFLLLSILFPISSLAIGKSINPCAVLIKRNIHHKLSATSQIVVVKVIAKNQALTTLCQWNEKTWSPVFTSNFKSVIGKNGLAAAGAKREGDLKTPAGLFPLTEVFGTRPMKLKMDYKYITAEDKFVDDVHSKDYNTWVTGPTAAKSYERMLIPVYQMGAVINYNMNPVKKGAGSAIFLHLWRSQTTPTSGCVAMEKKYLLAMLHWLDKNQRPYVMIY